MRPTRSSTRLAVPVFPDSYGPRCMCERSRTRPCCRSGPIPTLELRRKGAAMGPLPSPSFQIDRRGGGDLPHYEAFAAREPVANRTNGVRIVAYAIAHLRNRRGMA
jgi:hypothetical protein